MSTKPPVDHQLNTELQACAITDALSVDVEDYFHVEAFSAQVAFDTWSTYPSRVRQNTQLVLDLFARYRCRATFFVLGWVAERHSALVRAIRDAGHEVACHSYAHRQIFRLTPQQFRDDLRRARNAIEDAAGTRICGYRAPTFSILSSSLWALDILADEGFEYDSSIFPVHHDLYGFPDAPRTPHWRKLHGGRGLVEIPMSTVRLGGHNLPVGGGGYLRLLPMNYTHWAIERIHHREHRPVVFYFHPWELDPDQPRLKGPWKSCIRHYTGLSRMQDRIEQLLQRFRFAPLVELARAVAGNSNAYGSVIVNPDRPY